MKWIWIFRQDYVSVKLRCDMAVDSEKSEKAETPLEVRRIIINRLLWRERLNIIDWLCQNFSRIRMISSNLWFVALKEERYLSERMQKDKQNGALCRRRWLPQRLHRDRFRRSLYDFVSSLFQLWNDPAILHILPSRLWCVCVFVFSSFYALFSNGVGSVRSIIHGSWAVFSMSFGAIGDGFWESWPVLVVVS